MVILNSFIRGMKGLKCFWCTTNKCGQNAQTFILIRSFVIPDMNDFTINNLNLLRKCRPGVFSHRISIRQNILWKHMEVVQKWASFSTPSLSPSPPLPPSTPSFPGHLSVISLSLHTTLSTFKKWGNKQLIVIINFYIFPLLY